MTAKRFQAFDQSSRSVFGDLGLNDADEQFRKAKLGSHAYQFLPERKLKPRDIAELLGIKQPEVSGLFNGHFSRFTSDKLLDFRRRLDHKVTIDVRRHKSGKPHQGIGFVT